ncbi:hypothetical protein PIB30_032837 [Stylosanthes scabra]|uniref:Uncharacterized protein n=1 Tax=Stylosanthes scabra TaxID=79078 RepID=A0ABU6ZCK2_9FABA|nr:hypothetical protein [Stylosanthes scabra]
METKLSPSESDETAGDVETRISTEENYEGGEHVAQCTTKVRNNKFGAEFEKTQLPRVSNTSAATRTRGNTVLGEETTLAHGQSGVNTTERRVATRVASGSAEQTGRVRVGITRGSTEVRVENQVGRGSRVAKPEPLITPTDLTAQIESGRSEQPNGAWRLWAARGVASGEFRRRCWRRYARKGSMVLNMWLRVEEDVEKLPEN